MLLGLFGDTNIVWITSYVTDQTSIHFNSIYVFFFTGLTISNRPRTSDGGYAKLAIGSSCDRPQTSMENTVVEVCEKSTETTPSLYDQDSIDDFMFDTDEFDYLDDNDDDFSSYYEDGTYVIYIKDTFWAPS